MAHHNNTPASVLKAPKLQPRWVVRHTGPNRAQRRHLTLPKTGKVVTIPKAFRQPATNIPILRRVRPDVQVWVDEIVPFAA